MSVEWKVEAETVNIDLSTDDLVKSLSDEVCGFCGHGLPPEQYGEARALIEDILIEWDQGDLDCQRMVIDQMREWLRSQPGRPHIIAAIETARLATD